MKTNMNKKIIATLALSATLTLPAAVMAKIAGHCGNCHTMHNSQNGDPEAVLFTDGTPDSTATSATLNGILLKSDCIGCHTGDNETGGVKPYVLSIGDPGADILAGGNFYWVSNGDDGSGHNVVGLAEEDVLLSAQTNIPGGPAYTQVTCAGVTGCHGMAQDAVDVDISDNYISVRGGHHGTDGTPVTGSGGGTKIYVNGTYDNMALSYRMLNGIEGIEDSDWEMTNGAGDHNVYSGATSGTTFAADANGQTISSFCGRCHGTFHTSNGGPSPWTRHPTDFDMGTLAIGSEYADYTYNVAAPVASDDLANTGDIATYETAVTASLGGTATGDAIVTCISCHRAHGSPNADMLRWAYNTTDTMGVGTGCFICHTTKDE